MDIQPLSIHEKRKIGKTKGSIEIPSRKLGDTLNLNLNNTTRNFLTIVNQNGSNNMNSSMYVSKRSMEANNPHHGSIKLSPINQGRSISPLIHYLFSKRRPQK